MVEAPAFPPAPAPWVSSGPPKTDESATPTDIAIVLLRSRTLQTSTEAQQGVSRLHLLPVLSEFTRTPLGGS